MKIWKRGDEVKSGDRFERVLVGEAKRIQLYPFGVHQTYFDLTLLPDGSLEIISVPDELIIRPNVFNRVNISVDTGAEMAVDPDELSMAYTQWGGRL